MWKLGAAATVALTMAASPAANAQHFTTLAPPTDDNNSFGILGYIDHWKRVKADKQSALRSQNAAHMISENRCADARSYALGEGDMALATQVATICPAGPQSPRTAASAPTETVRTRF